MSEFLDSTLAGVLFMALVFIVCGYGIWRHARARRRAGEATRRPDDRPPVQPVGEAMAQPRFWDIVEDAHARSGGDMDRKCEALRSALAGLAPQEAIAFYQAFDAAMDRAYTWDLWGAAYVVNGGCGDDTFMDFRASLISRGRVAFEKALSDPESLADEAFDEKAWFYEGIQYAVMEGAQEAAGSLPDRLAAHPGSPAGEAWSEDEVQTLYPRLARAFTGAGEPG